MTSSAYRRAGFMTKLKKKEEIRIRCNNRCYYCTKEFTNWAEFNIDHVIPIVLGGKSNIENLVLSCFKCNSLKANYLLEDFQKIIKILLDSKLKEIEHLNKIIARLEEL